MFVSVECCRSSLDVKYKYFWSEMGELHKFITQYLFLYNFFRYVETTEVLSWSVVIKKGNKSVQIMSYNMSRQMIQSSPHKQLSYTSQYSRAQITLLTHTAASASIHRCLFLLKVLRTLSVNFLLIIDFSVNFHFSVCFLYFFNCQTHT